MEISNNMKSFILVAVMKNRLKCGSIGSIRTCPFKGKCSVCSALFPKWNREVESIQGVNGIFKKHPCDFYGKHYVERRMKKLFPELYFGQLA